MSGMEPIWEESCSWAMINALEVVVVGGNSQEGASAMVFAANPTLTDSDHSSSLVVARAPSTLVQRRAIDKEKTLNLLSQPSALPRISAGDARYEARDQAMSELFDRPDDREFMRNQLHRVLQLWHDVAL